MIRGLTVGLCLLIGTVAQADLIGDEVLAELLEDGQNLDGPDLVTVGDGPEGNWFGQIQYDLTSDTITVRSLVAPSPGQAWISGLAFSFRDLDWVNGPGRIVGVTVIASGGLGWNNIDNSELSWTDDSVLIDATDIAGVATNTDQFVTVKLATSHIPEPGSMILLGCGILGAAAVVRRRRQI